MDDDYRERVFRSSIMESLCLPVLAFVGGLIFTWLQNNALNRAVAGPLVLMFFAAIFSVPVLVASAVLFCTALYARRSVFAYLGMGLISALWIFLVLWANEPNPLGGMMGPLW